MATPTSMLFSLNGKDFMESYAKLESAHKYYRGTMQTVAQWSDTDGGGRFTKLISLDYISYLKQAIKSGKYSFGEYNEYYGRNKFKTGNKPWYLYGNVHDNLSVIWRGRHTQTVGIKKGIRVPRIGMSGKQYGTISIAKYAMINEFGNGNHPARPIFQYAMRDFIKEHFPPMVKAFERAFYREGKKESEKVMKRAATNTSAMGDVGDVLSQSSLGSFEAVNGKSLDRDFSSDLYQEGLSSDSRAMSTKDMNKGAALNNIGRGLDDAMVKMAKSMGMSVDELNIFLSEGDGS